MGAQSKSSELDTVAEQLTSAKADIARLTADLAELREENTGLKRDLQSARSERDDARDMVRFLDASKQHCCWCPQSFLCVLHTPSLGLRRGERRP